MRVLLLNPPFSQRISRATRGPAAGRSGTLYYPYWLAYAAGVLEAAGFDIRLVDAIARNHTVADILNIVKEFKPALVVMDVTAPTLHYDMQTARCIKKTCGGIIAAVGAHATALPHEILNGGQPFDVVARHEYDYTILDLAVHLREGKDPETIEGLTYWSNGRIATNPDRALIDDLDSLPFVSRVYKRHLHIRDYFYSANLYPEVTILSGRGCPHHCFWCLYPQTMTGHRYRMRSPENFVEELVYIRTELPEVREVVIEDDTFTANRARVHEICELILARRLKIHWACNVRADVDPKTLRLMKLAGCRMILAGFESGSQLVLDGMTKGLKLKTAHRFVRDAKAMGLIVHGCFTAGGINETHETLQETLQYAMDLDPNTAQFLPIMVYPGTRAFDWALENGYLVSVKFSDWITSDGSHNCQVTTPQLSAKHLTGFCHYARRRFYMRPRYLLRTALWASVRPSEWRRMARGFWNLSHFLIRSESKP